MAAWGQYTGGGPLILGRNNDDDLLYKRFGGSTVVVALRPTDSSIPAAFINYLGVIYSPTGMNRDGLILELNSGSSFRTDINRDLTLLHLLSWLQDYSTLDEVWPAFKSLRPNMSVLVNGADRKGAVSFECPLELECKRRGPDRDGLLAGTNHFTDPSWGTQFPEVLGTSWETDRGAYGATVARQRNLLALGDERKGQIDAAAMKAIFDTPLDVTTGKGGATVAGTIQSMVLVPQTLTLHLKAPGSFDWQKIELETLLNPQ